MEKELLTDYFTRYPHNDEVFENKGVLFHTRGAADSYGNSSDTVRYTRNAVMSEEVIDPVDDLELNGDNTLNINHVDDLKNEKTNK